MALHHVAVTHRIKLPLVTPLSELLQYIDKKLNFIRIIVRKTIAELKERDGKITSEKMMIRVQRTVPKS